MVTFCKFFKNFLRTFCLLKCTYLVKGQNENKEGEKMEKLKRAIILEELVKLTGDYKLAIVLNQLIYWTQFVKDVDAYMAEEQKRKQMPHLEARNGWVYKSSEELADETMMMVSKKTMREYLKQLIDCGWVEERRNPKFLWDHTKQYRVNLVKIQQDLQELGYSLQGYKHDFSLDVMEEKKGGVEAPRGEEPALFSLVEMEEHVSKGEGMKGSSNGDSGSVAAKGKRGRGDRKNVAPVGEIVAYLNETASKNFKAEAGKTRRLIQARFNEGFDLEDFKKVIDNKCFDWIADSRMSKFLRPETLFGPKFEAYLNEESNLEGEAAFERYIKELEKDG